MPSSLKNLQAKQTKLVLKFVHALLYFGPVGSQLMAALISDLKIS